MTRYSIEFDDEDGEPSLVERDDVSVCGRICFDQFDREVRFDCRPPEWMLAALSDAWMAWKGRDTHGGGDT